MNAIQRTTRVVDAIVEVGSLRKAGALPCTNRAFMDEVEALGVSFEREADSPVCWKQ